MVIAFNILSFLNKNLDYSGLYRSVKLKTLEPLLEYRAASISMRTQKGNDIFYLFCLISMKPSDHSTAHLPR